MGRGKEGGDVGGAIDEVDRGKCVMITTLTRLDVRRSVGCGGL